jgi:hypothetical protein
VLVGAALVGSVFFVASCTPPPKPVVLSRPAPASAPASAPVIEVEPPLATAHPPPCPLGKIQKFYASGEWKQSEGLAQQCLRDNPLESTVRLMLARIYLMRAYAAHEARWLDEARRQLQMAQGDPTHAKEASDLLQLVEQPTVE